MIDKIKKTQTLQMILTEIFLVYLAFWFLLNNLSTNGIWETVILNVLFFFVLPQFLIGDEKKPITKLAGIDWKTCLGILSVWLVFFLLILKGGLLAFVKINYLSRVDWFLNDWWMVFFLNLILIPLIIYSQEFFFRKFLIIKFRETLSIKTSIFLQAGLFTVFEVLFFEIFKWQFILFNFILALILGWFYIQTRAIWYSFLTRWIMILILDGVILYKVQQLKI